MNVIKVKNYDKMSEEAASYLYRKMSEVKPLNLGLATGGTPEKTYELIVEKANNSDTSFQHVHTYNLDEYVGLTGENPNSYRYYMNQLLFNKLKQLPIAQTHLPNGNAESLSHECRQYEKLIAEAGGIDVQLLGIGGNGHIGFNEPGTPFSSRTHVVQLDEETRQANARFFDSLDQVPTHAITMGVATIMEAKGVLLLASGEGKAEAMDRLLSGSVDESFPASILKRHPNVTIIADEAALSQYSGRTFA